jgi:hypothetical protein
VLSLFDGLDGMTDCRKGTKDGCISGNDENITIPAFVTIGNNEHVDYGDTISKIKKGTRKDASLVRYYPWLSKNAVGNNSDIPEKCGSCRKSCENNSYKGTDCYSDDKEYCDYPHGA